MNRRFASRVVTVFTTIVLFNGHSFAADAQPKPTTRPNVVIIVADDLGYGDLSVQGGTDISTPNIDSIATNGIRFTNGYVTGPYCSPTRAGLVSGRYQERHGHDFNPDGNYDDGPEVGLSLEESTIADAFKGAGYRTAAIGKWHLGVTPQLQPTSRGFDEFFGFLPAAHPYLPNANPTTRPARPKIPGQAPGTLLRGSEVVDESGYTTEAFGREASAFIERNKDHSFFLYLATNAVHAPLQAPEKYLARFPKATGKRQTYLAMLSALDDTVGKVLTALHDTGAEDNTLIYFLSDNGGPPSNGSTNGPLSGGKMTVWEGGIRVPFFVQWKSHVPQGVELDQPVVQIDIFPTAIAAAGIPTPKNKQFDGRNILPLITGTSKDAPHDGLFWRFGKQWAVREGQWKLARLPGIDKPRLFDLANDTAEAEDKSAEYPEMVEQLKKDWDTWNKDNIDPRWVPPAQLNGKMDKKAAERSPKGTADESKADVANP